MPNAWNDTPYWVIRVTADISKDHGDTRNPRLGELLDRIARGNRLYETDVELWMVTGDGKRLMPRQEPAVEK